MKGVLKNGLIHPQDPVPEDWEEGTEVEIRKHRPTQRMAAKDRADEWMDAVEASAAKGSVEDDRRLMEALAAIRKRNKKLAHRKPNALE